MFVIYMEYVLRCSTITDAHPIVGSRLEARAAGNGGAYRGLLAEPRARELEGGVEQFAC